MPNDEGMTNFETVIAAVSPADLSVDDWKGDGDRREPGIAIFNSQRSALN
jgi:hypothetical protein